jgi:hypothetical protein
MLGFRTLEGLDTAAAKAILADAAAQLLEQMGVPIAPPTPAAATTELLSELRANVKPNQHEDDEHYLSRLASVLSDSMSSAVLSSANLQEVRNRAGRRGTLPPSLYHLQFTRHFHAQKDLLSIRESYVERAVQQADMVQHLSPSGFPENGLYVSLFVKTPTQRQLPNHTLLIRADRIGAELFIGDAFYLFHDAFHWNDLSSPLSMLFAFLDAFSLPIVLDEKPEKIILDRQLTFPDNGIVKLRMVDNSIFNIVGKPGDTITITLAYGFNQGRYADYLKAHGIESRPVGPVHTATTAQQQPRFLAAGALLAAA